MSTRLLTLGLVTAAACGAAVPPLVLVEGGQARAAVVIAGDAPAMVRRAAAELQDHLERRTGARLPLLTDRRPDAGVAILVGESAVTRALGLTLDGLGPDGFRWRTGPDWLAILGRDHRGGPVVGMRNPWQYHEIYNPDLELGAFGEAGTYNGVCRFLERFGGVRWFMPGEVGTVVPADPDLRVEALDEVHAPDFEYRYPWLCNFAIAPEDALWFRRIGFGGVAPVQAIDSFRMFLKYKDEHPEYFALVDGQRDTAALCCITGGGHLCLSNEGLRRQLAADIRAYFDSHPDQAFFPVAPNDGMTRVCGCEHCGPEVQPARGPQGQFSNPIWGFVNALAADIASTHPNRFLGTIAYEGYLEPPDNLERLHPNLAVMICQSRSSFADPASRQRARDLLARWQAKTSRLYLWEYYRDNLPPFPWCPEAYPHLIADDLRALKGVTRGEFIESESWGTGEDARIHYPAMQHLNLYVTAKCLWDSSLDVDGLMRDYASAFYGPAATPMAEFWRQAEALHLARPLDNVVARYPTAEVDGLLAYLDQALALAPADSDYRRRVDLVRTDVAKLREVLGTPLVRELPALTAYRSSEPIRLDGVLDDPAWRDSLPQGFVLKNGEAAPYRSLLVASHTPSHLYVAIANVEPEMTTLRVQAHPKDPAAAVWDDDCIEVFLSPDADHPERAFQLVINPAGTVWDGAYGLPEPGPGLFGCQPAWTCEGLQVATGRTATRWTVELAIPWTALGLTGDALPKRLALNAYRCRRGNAPPVFSAWSPPLQEAHFTPKRFGALWLKDTPAPAGRRSPLLPRSTDDVGSGAANGPGWYTPGGVLDGKPFVGNPNTLTRRDRLVIRFDLAPLAIAHGETGVGKALLRLLPASFHGPDASRRIEVAHLDYDTGVLSWKDVVSDRAVAIGTVEVPKATASTEGLTLDVTTQVNADLRLGRAASAFRVRDLASEEGNPDMQPDGLCFPAQQTAALRLEVSE